MGASAGGLEAFTVFLKTLSPNPGVALILVPHLDPSRESAFSQILARTTSLPVCREALPDPIEDAASAARPRE